MRPGNPVFPALPWIRFAGKDVDDLFANKFAAMTDFGLRASHRHRVDLVLAAHQFDVGAHRARGAVAVAAHDRHHHGVVFGLGFGQPAEMAERGARDRLPPYPRRQRHLDIRGLRNYYPTMNIVRRTLDIDADTDARLREMAVE